jgi:hypothetical protein
MKVQWLITSSQTDCARDRSSEFGEEREQVVFVDVPFCGHAFAVIAFGNVTAQQVRDGVDRRAPAGDRRKRLRQQHRF